MIGIFDSGVGGLSVYKEIKKVLPNTRVIYLADQANAPYGKKSEEKIRSLTLKSILFLAKKGAMVVVIACNSASVSGLTYYRENISIPIIGLVPAIKPAAKNHKTIAILSTEVTAKSKKLQEYIDTYSNNATVYNLSNNYLVSCIEQIDFSSTQFKQEVVKVVDTLKTLSVDALVLGCTHFVFLEKYLKNRFNNLTFYNSGKAVAKQVKRVYKYIPVKKVSKGDIFITTGNAKHFSAQIESLLRLKVEVKSTNLV